MISRGPWWVQWQEDGSWVVGHFAPYRVLSDALAAMREAELADGECAWRVVDGAGVQVLAIAPAPRGAA